MKLVESCDLTLQRDGRILLQDFHCTLMAGQIHALLGPNGAGKSTVLRLLAGEWLASHGRIELQGRALSRLDAVTQARQRAVLPQLDTLSFGFTSREVVTLGRHAHGDSTSTSGSQIVDTVMIATDTHHLATRRYPQLSGGERRRVQLARTLAQVWDVDHAVLLLDEPTSGLDPAHQHQIMTLLRSLSTRGMGIVLSVHELNLAAIYADAASLLRDGRLLAQGATAEVLTAPQLERLYGPGLSFTAQHGPTSTQWLATPRAVTVV